MPKLTGFISDIQRFSLHDGPGIRTTVYLKGCIMRCPWCHNPEAIDPKPTLAFYAGQCIGCQACAQVCEPGAIVFRDGERHFDAVACTNCFRCVSVCPAQALVRIGKSMSTEEVMAVIHADLDYYQASGGGVTLSGGEPLLQASFAYSLLEACQEENIDTAIESNLSIPFAALEPLLVHINRIYCDIKIMDEQKHLEATGLSNRQLLANLEQLALRKIPLVIRTPLIPGWTDQDDNIQQIARWIHEHCPNATYELLNYNAFARAKYAPIDLPYTLGDIKPLTADRVQALTDLARSEQVTVIGPK
ncbi:MAG: glycyl-radical enzyme activating protein [Bacillota bacterium]|nr:glycyl-radical enzyme activating protein [Bacillota bacterium]